MRRTTGAPHERERTVTVRGTPTIDEAVAIYLQLRKAKFAADTWQNDKSQLLRLARALDGLQVGSITSDRMEQFFLGSGGIADVMAPASFTRF